MSYPEKNKGTTQQENEHIEEWQEVEVLVLQYKKQFTDPREKQKSDAAIISLIERFFPLFKKYIVTIKSGHINFSDPEARRFVYCFMGDYQLKIALKQRYINAQLRNAIYQRFNFVKETYGFLTESEIMNDLTFLFIGLVNRYQPIGKSFCGYCYNCYCYEVSRFIKKFIKDPTNIHYRNTEYEDYMQFPLDEIQQLTDKPFEDRVFENVTGIPDFSWVEGRTCSEPFSILTPFERSLLVKYYLERYNDKQIADSLGVHINIINSRRKAATEKIAKVMNIDITYTRKGRK